MQLYPKIVLFVLETTGCSKAGYETRNMFSIGDAKPIRRSGTCWGKGRAKEMGKGEGKGKEKGNEKRMHGKQGKAREMRKEGKGKE